MKIIFNFLFIGALILFPFQLLAQKTLSGTVVDTHQKPLFNVEIYTPEIHQQKLHPEYLESLLFLLWDLKHNH